MIILNIVIIMYSIIACEIKSFMNYVKTIDFLIFSCIIITKMLVKCVVLRLFGA